MKTPALPLLALAIAAFALSMPLNAKSAPPPLLVEIIHVPTLHDAVMAAMAYGATIKGADMNSIGTNSMEPHFPAKRTVYVFEPGEPQVGQPIAFRHNGTGYVHQLTQSGAGRYVTRGTNTAATDAGYRTRKDLLGVVRKVWVAKSIE